MDELITLTTVYVFFNVCFVTDGEVNPRYLTQIAICIGQNAANIDCGAVMFVFRAANEYGYIAITME